MKKEVLLAHFPRITVKRYRDLVRTFSSLNAAWTANFDELTHLGWDHALVGEFLAWRDTIDEKRITKILTQEQIICITQDDDAYPPLLKEIYDPPFCLFVRGHIPEHSYNLAVVGTRKANSYGKQLVHDIVTPLVHQGITIVSGLALGIDALAHNAALANNGTTIAVLGSGCNDRHIYPAAHRHLARRIVENGGAVISEYPPGAMPSKFTFPRRNRIIAGMSLGTLVVQAGEKSGALITSTCAMEVGRDVFAIPHPITMDVGAGPNKLLKEGAHLVTSPEDIIETLDLKNIGIYATNKEIIPDTPTEATLLNILTKEPTHIEVLIRESTLTSAEVTSTLTLMEMKGMVRNLGNMMYVRSR